MGTLELQASAWVVAWPHLRHSPTAMTTFDPALDALICHRCDKPAKWLVGLNELPECDDHFLDMNTGGTGRSITILDTTLDEWYDHKEDE
jgi:hypothetical protein